MALLPAQLDLGNQQRSVRLYGTPARRQIGSVAMPICATPASRRAVGSAGQNYANSEFVRYLLLAASQACISAISFSWAVMIASAIALVEGSVANSRATLAMSIAPW